MAVAESAGLGPVLAFALVGVCGVGAQWLAWRMRLPAIVIMLVAGLIAGPATGLLNPSRDFGELLSPLIALAVAVILFEGGSRWISTVWAMRKPGSGGLSSSARRLAGFSRHSRSSGARG
ncbi:hypothetical protein [Thioclava nitratireducens]|uniref:hypothetical protein n=1 Tax=Thioclava nitratireducens TaxID=1915078 RepID=UPI003CC69E26